MCKVGHWEASHVCPQTWPSFSALIQLLKWKLYLCQCVEQHALVLVCVVSFYGKPIAMCGGVWWYGFLPDPVFGNSISWYSTQMHASNSSVMVWEFITWLGDLVYRGTVLTEGNLELKGLKRACARVCVCLHDCARVSVCGERTYCTYVCLLVVDVVCMYDII